jgi:hypothetical protein
MKNWQLLLSTGWPFAAESFFVLLLALLLPWTILLHIWDDNFLSLPSIVLTANRLKRLSDLILVIVPLASLYIASSVAFGRRLGKDGHALGNKFFVFFFFFPIILLLFMQVPLYAYLNSTRGLFALEGQHLVAARIAIYVTIACLLWLDFFKSIFEAGSKQPTLTSPLLLSPPASQAPASGPSQSL